MPELDNEIEIEEYLFSDYYVYMQNAGVTYNNEIEGEVLDAKTDNRVD